MFSSKVSVSLSLVMAIALPWQQVHASHAGVETAIKNLQYGLTVTWNQSPDNLAERDLIIDAFHKEMDVLLSQGVTASEVLDTVKAQMLDADGARMVDAIGSNPALSQVEKLKALQTLLMETRHSGAHWMGNGDGMRILGFVVIVPLLIWVISLDRDGVESPKSDNPYYGCYFSCPWN